MPAPPFTSSPNVLPASEPDPSPPPPGRTLRVVVRVLLWTLIGIAALHGVLPPPAAPRGSGPLGAPAHSSPGPRGPASQASAKEQAAMATAAAFLREYLTVDGRRAEGPGRFKRYLARGVEMDDGVVPQPGISQSMDLVVPAGVQPAQGGMEVTVVAHLLRSRDGPVEDGGTVAFVVPMVTGSSGTAVGGIPRPAALPFDPGLTSRPLTLPTALARDDPCRCSGLTAARAVPCAPTGRTVSARADDRSAADRAAPSRRRAGSGRGAGPGPSAGAAAVGVACVSPGRRRLDAELGGRVRPHDRAPAHVIRRPFRDTSVAARPCGGPLASDGVCAGRRHAGGRGDRRRRPAAPAAGPGPIAFGARLRCDGPPGCPDAPARREPAWPSGWISPDTQPPTRRRRMAAGCWGGADLHGARRGIGAGGGCDRRARRSAATPAASWRSHGRPRVAMPSILETARSLHRARHRVGVHGWSRAGVALRQRVGPSRSALCRARPRRRLDRNSPHRRRGPPARQRRGPSLSGTERHRSACLP